MPNTNPDFDKWLLDALGFDVAKYAGPVANDAAAPGEQKQIGAAQKEIASGIAALGAGLGEVIEQPEKLVAALQARIDTLFKQIDGKVDAVLEQAEGAKAGQLLQNLQTECESDPTLAALSKAAAIFKTPDPKPIVARMFAATIAAVTN
jgi:hypothetical protein